MAIRMLSRPYFPGDQVLTLTPEDRTTLRDYYDFLVTYENTLRDKVEPADIPIEIDQAPHKRQRRSGHHLDHRAQKRCRHHPASHQSHLG